MEKLYNYYSNILLKDGWIEIDKLFSNDNCQSFIYDKLPVEIKDFFENTPLKISEDRAVHTVSSFLLGILIKNELKFDMRDLPKPTGDYFTSFMYFWKLTCLCHDMAYSIEEESNKIFEKYPTIYDFEKEYKIEYDMLKETKNRILFEQYYKYRIENGDGKGSENPHRIDHGICCGLLLYNSMMKEYYQYKEDNDNKNNLIDYKKFNKKFPEYALKISEAIARHNIWLSNEKNYSIYEKYNLNELIHKSFENDRIKYGKGENLLLLLGLVDTIEPAKNFASNNETALLKILKELDVGFNNRNKEMTIFSSEHINNNIFKKWIDLDKWLDICVEHKASKIKFGINKFEEYEKIA